MLKVKQCEDKIRLYEHKVHVFKNGTPDQIEYTEHLKRLIEGYKVELAAARLRKEPPIGADGYQFTNPRLGKCERGAYEIWSFNPRTAFI